MLLTQEAFDLCSPTPPHWVNDATLHLKRQYFALARLQSRVMWLSRPKREKPINQHERPFSVYWFLYAAHSARSHTYTHTDRPLSRRFFEKTHTHDFCVFHRLFVILPLSMDPRCSCILHHKWRRRVWYVSRRRWMPLGERKRETPARAALLHKNFDCVKVILILHGISSAWSFCLQKKPGLIFLWLSGSKNTVLESSHISRGTKIEKCVFCYFDWVDKQANFIFFYEDIWF